VSIFLPAFNEAGNLDGAVRDVVAAATAELDDHEVLVVDDGSTDGTGAIADALAREFPTARVLHQPRNLGLAAGYRRALAEARLEYFGFLPGDREVTRDSIERIFQAVGSADLVVPYHGNSRARARHRRLLTWVSTLMLNHAIGVQLRYYQGPCIYPTDLARALPKTGRGFFFLAEMLVHALGSGLTYVEVPLTHQERTHGRSKAVSLGNLGAAVATIARVWWSHRVGRGRAGAVR
jgi:glycosyltransferase involved in cell wall biosynthesis